MWYATTMVDVHQCPKCELRFATKWELQDHLDEAHPGAIQEGKPPAEPERR